MITERFPSLFPCYNPIRPLFIYLFSSVLSFNISNRIYPPPPSFYTCSKIRKRTLAILSRCYIIELGTCYDKYDRSSLHPNRLAQARRLQPMSSNYNNPYPNSAYPNNAYPNSAYPNNAYPNNAANPYYNPPPNQNPYNNAYAQSPILVQSNVLNQTYMWMTGGLCLTAVIALAVFQSGLLLTLNPIVWFGLIIVEL